MGHRGDDLELETLVGGDHDSGASTGVLVVLLREGESTYQLRLEKLYVTMGPVAQPTPDLLSPPCSQEAVLPSPDLPRVAPASLVPRRKHPRRRTRSVGPSSPVASPRLGWRLRLVHSYMVVLTE